MNGNIDIDYTKYLSSLDYGGTRNSQTRNFAARSMRLKKCESNFWFRACQLAKLFNDFFKEDFLFNPNHKKTSASLQSFSPCKSTTKPTPEAGDFYVTAELVKEQRNKKLQLPLH